MIPRKYYFQQSLKIVEQLCLRFKGFALENKCFENERVKDNFRTNNVINSAYKLCIVF